MNTRSWQDRHRLQIRIAWHNNAYYLDRIQDLEQIILREPEEIELELIGIGDIPPDTALVIRSVLTKRQPKTRIITNARSSLQHAAVLLWLLGDERYIRDDAQFFFRKPNLPDEEIKTDKTDWQDDPIFRDAFSDVDPEENDYAQVLQLINEYLPVNELTGRFIDVGLLRQFGLIENEEVDNFLATVFASNPEPKPVSPSDTESQQTKQQSDNPTRQLNK